MDTMTRLAVLLSCCTQERNSSWVMHKYIPKGDTDCHKLLQNMLDGMADKGVLLSYYKKLQNGSN